ncbi:lytic murein transglycosylase B [Coralloluteibacterium stylophorae]|uniref:Lytic murein transglycosylase B n=1 Tax=Coralloluteibacterium stylophorae TaxID=1776034 RepID=A0A8J7VTY7_9GAMM|nr:lytic murein transglycosylase B [Coralloluteibacterium stylophorae]MBS7458793.1 lytic murein transglycosylase B [Coralloluteibacterium stylophorae]
MFYRLCFVLFAALAAGSVSAQAPNPRPPAEAVEAFVEQTVAEHGVAAEYVRQTLDKARYQRSISVAMSRPAEAKPWKDYRPNFITDARIRAGRAFLAEHRDALAKVEADSGVPAALVTSIIGVETNWGGYTGKYRVLDALYTLAFFYPRSGDPERAQYEADRETFFRRELGNLFELARTEQVPIDTVTGSYAGAMGWGQFMPSSYLAYAVDGDGDGRRDLFDSVPDILASVANYFAAHGWQRGAPVVARAVREPGAPEWKPETWRRGTTFDDLASAFERDAAAGYRPAQPTGALPRATLVSLEAEQGMEYWYGFNNFFVITRYNHSPLYGMAVYQLAAAIDDGAGAALAAAGTAAP